MSKLRLIAFAGVAALALVACGKNDAPATNSAAGSDQMTANEDNGDAMTSDSMSSESSDSMSADSMASEAPDYEKIAAEAVADPGRPEEDRANDANRKPEPTLAFMMVAPGDNVFEIEAGGGYYTEMVSRAVAPDGSVVMQNPEGFKKFLGDKLDLRVADNRLPNVRQSFSNFDHLDAEDGSMDIVTWIWGPHELYYHPDSGSLGDPEKAYAEIFRILKPGGAFVVIDHRAVDGAPETTGNDLHRIDPAIVKAAAEKAGLVLDAEGDFMKNPDDPHDVSVFDKSIRGHTDQFALRFRKPAA